MPQCICRQRIAPGHKTCFRGSSWDLQFRATWEILDLVSKKYERNISHIGACLGAYLFAAREFSTGAMD